MIHPDYDFSTVISEFLGETIWQHRAISKDRQRAITIAYSTSHKHTLPPVYHFHETNPTEGESYDGCDVVEAPCSAEIDLLIDLFDLGTMTRLHSGTTDPGVQFWRMMVSRLASYVRGPVKYEYEDREESSCTELQQPESRDVSDCAIESDESQASGASQSSQDDLSDTTRSANGDDGYREATPERPSGTIRVVH